MAIAQKDQPTNVGNTGNVQGNTQTQAKTEGIGSPISNEAYNVITALQAKLEGLEAYRKYARDGSEQIWKQLCQSELQSVEKLCTELERIVKDGKLRMREPGVGNA